ncbi:MAG: zf-HC2 domain-containing protein [Kofleriaceae bacterium]
MQCPDEAEISEFAGRALAPRAASRIEAHIADCDGCRELVFALASRGEVTGSDGTEAETRRVGLRSARRDRARCDGRGLSGARPGARSSRRGQGLSRTRQARCRR